MRSFDNLLKRYDAIVTEAVSWSKGYIDKYTLRDYDPTNEILTLRWRHYEDWPKQVKMSKELWLKLTMKSQNFERDFNKLRKNNALEWIDHVTEAKVSPFASSHPSFGGVTKQMSARGMSSAPYDTVKFIATFLNNLDIIDSAELSSVLKAAGFKGKQLALLDVIKAKSADIVAKSQEIADAMPEALEDYINRATINRGRDTMANLGVEGGSGGRTEKYAKQAAERAEKKKVAAQNKMQKQALKAAAKSEDSGVQNAVDVLVSTLDTTDKILMGQEGRGIVSAGLGLKGAEDVNLDFDDIDISIGDVGEVRDTLIDKLVKFFNKQGKYTAEKTRRGLNVEGPTGSFGTDVEDVQDMITTLVMRAYPDIDGDQIIVDLNAGSPSEDEEYDPEKADIDNDGETEDWEEGLAKKRGFVSQGEEDEEGGVQTLKHLLKGLGFKAAKPGLNTYYSDADKIIELYGIPMRAGHYADIFVAITDNPNEPYTLVDAEGSTEFTNANDIVKELQKRSGSTEDEEYGCGCEDEECNCEEESMVSESYTSVYLTEMTRKSYGKAPAPQTVTFKERMKPKTIWQLNELRNYGL